MADGAPDLLHLLKSCGVQDGARVLRIGAVSAAVDRKLIATMAGLGAKGFAVSGDAFNVPFPRDMDAVIVALPVAATPDVFEELIYGRVAPSLAQGGVAIVQFCRDASDAALEAMNVAPAARATLQNFLQANFGAATIDTLSPVAKRFADDGVFECMGWAPRSKADVRTEPMVWLALRKRLQVTRQRAIARSQRPDRYSIGELGALVTAMRHESMTFALPDEFVAHIRAGEGAGLIKLDLHRNIRRPPEVARTLRDAGAMALFLMMHKHPFNEAFFDADETWDILKSIRDDGHEVGLHLDPFHLVRAFGDLYAGVESALADFSKRSFTVRAATLHGDTSAHVAAVGMKAWDFFAEDAPRRGWNGTPPAGEAFFADHVGRYSHAQLAAKFGVAHMAEAHYRHNGELIAPNALLYLTDNSRSLQLTNIFVEGGGTRAISVGEQFRIPPLFAHQIAPALRNQPFLALFHPQWFW